MNAMYFSRQSSSRSSVTVFVVTMAVLASICAIIGVYASTRPRKGDEDFDDDAMYLGGQYHGGGRGGDINGIYNSTYKSPLDGNGPDKFSSYSYKSDASRMQQGGNGPPAGLPSFEGEEPSAGEYDNQREGINADGMLIECVNPLAQLDMEMVDVRMGTASMSSVRSASTSSNSLDMRAGHAAGEERVKKGTTKGAVTLSMRDVLRQDSNARKVNELQGSVKHEMVAQPKSAHHIIDKSGASSSHSSSKALASTHHASVADEFANRF